MADNLSYSQSARLDLGPDDADGADDDGDAGEADDADGPGRCGADLSDGGTCDRAADACPYHDAEG